MGDSKFDRGDVVVREDGTEYAVAGYLDEESIYHGRVVAFAAVAPEDESSMRSRTGEYESALRLVRPARWRVGDVVRLSTGHVGLVVEVGEETLTIRWDDGDGIGRYGHDYLCLALVSRPGVELWQLEARPARVMGVTDEEMSKRLTEAREPTEHKLSELGIHLTEEQVEKLGARGIEKLIESVDVVDDLVRLGGHTRSAACSAVAEAILSSFEFGGEMVGMVVFEEGEVIDASYCPECHGTGVVELFTSTGPCSMCGGAK